MVEFIAFTENCKGSIIMDAAARDLANLAAQARLQAELPVSPLKSRDAEIVHKLEKLNKNLDTIQNRIQNGLSLIMTKLAEKE